MVSEMAYDVIHCRWLEGHKPRPNAALRLFCFPFAGGSAASFRSWQSNLPHFIETFPAQLPGRGGRFSETPLRRLTEIVEGLGHVLPSFLDRPFAFFGHSMGGLIAFELARWLRRERNVSPVHIFVSGRRAPQLPERDPITYDLPEPEFLQRLRSLNGTPKRVLDHPELMQLMIPMLRADFSVCETYEYRRDFPLDCPLTIFGGIEDTAYPREHLELWREHTTSSFSLHMFPGDHFFLKSAQHEMLDVIAQQLAGSNCLAQA
jgi:medium-chain acyl-[acyl-carrier-protein] hydrolase